MKTEVSALSPRVAFLDHQRLILNVDNSALKQRIAALAQDKIFKDGKNFFLILINNTFLPTAIPLMQSWSTMISKYKELLPWPMTTWELMFWDISMWHEMIKVVIILFDTESPSKLLITPSKFTVNWTIIVNLAIYKKSMQVSKLCLGLGFLLGSLFVESWQKYLQLYLK